MQVQEQAQEQVREQVQEQVREQVREQIQEQVQEHLGHHHPHQNVSGQEMSRPALLMMYDKDNQSYFKEMDVEQKQEMLGLE